MIWMDGNDSDMQNQYVCFRREVCLKPYQTGELRIACDSDYCLWINGEFVGNGQLPSFPEIRYFDSYRIEEQNLVVCILCRYYGANNASYVKGEPFVHYEIVTDVETIDDNDTYCKKASGYQSGETYKVTGMIGYGIIFDKTKDENWCAVDYRMDRTWRKAVKSGRKAELLERPIQKMVTAGLVKAKILDSKNQIYQFDKEYCGYISLKVSSEKSTEMKIWYGEREEQVAVEGRIGDHNYYFHYTTTVGQQEFTNYFLRSAAKYIRIEADQPVTVEYVGIVPCYYPLTFRQCPEYLSERERKIYEVGVNTLLNCMHDHYEDCPIREQALYAMDMRNQALCTYTAFENPEFAFFSLKLLADSIREDGFLELTAPARGMNTIPSFTFIWILAVYDYLLYTGDEEGTKELLTTVEAVFDRLSVYVKDGLFVITHGNKIWNFHDWADGLDGYVWENGCRVRQAENEPEKYDAILNLYYVMALEAYQKILNRLKSEKDITGFIQILKANINKMFLDHDTGIYYSFCRNGHKYHQAELTQALAILCGIADERTKENLFRQNDLVKVSLSYMIFKLSAMDDKELVRREIEKVWGSMIDQGATCFWETLKGGEDFNGNVSLCHGWSAIPIYFYHLFDDAQNKEHAY